MCGIVGVMDSPHAAEELFLGLQNLQHRGQDGGGIVTLDGDGFHPHHGIGLLDIAFPPDNFKRLTGTMGIGHTRYATVGKQNIKQLQPFFVADIGLALAHNGNIVNFHTLQETVWQTAPDALGTGCDSEILLWLLGENLRRFGCTVDGLHQSVAMLATQVIGSYSVVGILRDVGLFAFRDPNGLRPLMMGRRQNEDAADTLGFASETTALEFLGFEDLDTVQPGELVWITPDRHIHRRSFAAATPHHCMFEWVYFARVESCIEDLSVYQARFNLGAQLAKAVRARGIEADIVVPVPETSRIAAIALAEQLDVPFREVLIKNRYVNRTFILESQTARKEAIKRKLYPVAFELKDKKVLVVDDSIVRGNTAIKIVELLRKSGAAEIYLASTCPPIQYPCYYGIDFPEHDELLAGQHTAEELPGVLGVDALIYQSVEGLTEALNQKTLCTACITNQYPTDISQGSHFSEQRALERSPVLMPGPVPITAPSGGKR